MRVWSIWCGRHWGRGEYENVEMWKCGNVEMWKCGNVELIIIKNKHLKTKNNHEKEYDLISVSQFLGTTNLCQR